MNEEMEAEMTKMDLTPDHLAYSKDEGADEAIPIHFKKLKNDKSIQRDNEPRYRNH